MAKEAIKDPGKNVRIPTKDYLAIKAHVKKTRGTIGGFVALAALDRIKYERQNVQAQ